MKNDDNDDLQEDIEIDKILKERLGEDYRGSNSDFEELLRGSEFV